MADFRGKKLTVRRDRTVVWGNEEIGDVYGTFGDLRVNHDWSYWHKSGVTRRDLHPDLSWGRSLQDTFTMRDAAEMLVSLHLEIEASRG